MTKKEFMEQNKKAKQEIVSCSVICFISAVVTAIAAINSDNYYLFFDVVLVLVLGLLILFKQSFPASVILLVLSVISCLIGYINTGRMTGWLLLIAGITASMYTYKLDKEYKQYVLHGQSPGPGNKVSQNNKTGSKARTDVDKSTIKEPNSSNIVKTDKNDMRTSTISDNRHEIDPAKQVDKTYTKKSVNVHPETIASNEGHYLMYITRDEARNGCVKTFEFDGEKVEVKIPFGAREDTAIKVPNAGYKIDASGKRGDLIVELMID